MLLVLLGALQAPLPITPDGELFPDRSALIRLYTDCDEARWPGLADTLVPKSALELVVGRDWRLDLERRWRRYFADRAGDSLRLTDSDDWAWPLAQRVRLTNNFRSPREGGPHDALDIFVREGTEIRSPVTGVVVAAGDDWRGGWVRRRGLYYEGGGMSRRQGNGLMLFEPSSGGYFLFSHLRPGVPVRAGDIVRRGQPLGRVGRTGNAAEPGRGRHLHLAYKVAGSACGVDGVLVAVNPYSQLRAARLRREDR